MVVLTFNDMDLKKFFGSGTVLQLGTLRPSASSQVELDQHQNHSHSGPK